MKFSYRLCLRFMLIMCILVVLYMLYTNNFNIQHYIEPKYKLVVVAIFKNESGAMKEWLQHYVNQGVDHFYMINNDSTDNWKSKIQGFPVTVYSDDTPSKQIEHYNNYCLEEVKKNAEWVMVIDLDEFMYARKGFRTIPEYLDTLNNNIGEVRVKFKMFGSNGHIKQPESLVNGFTKRKKSNHKGPDKTTGSPTCDGINNQVKSIVRVNNLVSFIIHSHNLKLLSKIITLPETTLESDLTEQPLHLNHYWTQSWEWFQEHKINRGSAAGSKNRFSEETFKGRDWNDVVDTELSNMTP